MPSNIAILMPDAPEEPDESITKQREQSVQILPEVSKQGVSNTMSLAGFRGTILPPYGTRERQYALRDWYRMDEQAMVRGAFTGIAKEIAGLPWEISGDTTPNPIVSTIAANIEADSGVEYYQEMLRQGNFGAGWAQLIEQTVLDYLRFDTGAFIEVIAPGESWEEITGPVTGIAHMDALRCLPTGDPHYPAIYWDRWGGLHAMHHTRVIMIQDMNDGDDLRPGYGDSALSRAISIAAREMWISRYINTYLDDEPAPGLDIIGGIVKTEFERVEAQWKNTQQRDTPSPWGRRMRYYTADPSIMPKIESHTFQDAPEKFDFRVYVDIDVDMLALAMNVDRQELMQLTGANIGSQGQSIILHQKSKGKTIGTLIAEIERRINDLLPDGYTFAFRYRDEEEAKSEAEKANLWADVISKIGTLLTDDQKRVLLSSQSEAVHDAISDAPRANDVDIPVEQPIVAGDDASGAEAVATTDPVTDVEPLAKVFKKKPFNESDVNRDEGGQFSSGGGGIGAVAGIARDSNGQPEFIPAGHGKPLVKNPYYSGKPSGKPAPAPNKPAPSAKPADKPDPFNKPVQSLPKPKPKPETDKPKPLQYSEDKPATKPVQGKKPDWSNPKRKPGVDADGYQDYAGMEKDDAATSRAYEISKQHGANLSTKQREAAQIYTGGDYEDINGGLRKGKIPKAHQKTIRELDSAIDQSRLPENTALYRGVRLTPAMREKLRPGATFSDNAYTSTSINPSIPESFAHGKDGAIIRIKAKKGQRGLSVDSFSNFEGEREILLPRNTGYRITNVYTDAKTGKTYIDAEILGND